MQQTQSSFLFSLGRWSAATLPDQFVFGRDPRAVPDSWHVQQIGEWHVGTDPSLPRVTLLDPAGSAIGCFLGYVIDRTGTLLSTGSVSVGVEELSSPDALETWIYSHGGRFVAALFGASYNRVYLDPSGSLSAVYCPALELVASTPALVPGRGDTVELVDLNRAMNIPFRDAMYPVGLTPRRNVWRLLPNHYLDLKRFEPVRHWPSCDSLVTDSNDRLLDRIVEGARRQVGAILRRHHATFGLTAGHDSRMLLACARPYADRLTLFTAEFEPPDETAWLDASTARAIASELGLRYFRLRFRRPTSEDLEEWILRTGGCVGEVRGWRGSTTYRHLPKNHFDVIAAVSELMRGYYWRPGDDPGSTITPERLVAICGTGPHPLALNVMRHWLDTLPTRDPLLTLDLFYLEQRMGCWAGVSPYAHGDDGRPEIYPLNHRDVIEAMLSLPWEGRRTALFQKQIISRCWPELSRHPFNTPTRRQRLGLGLYRARCFVPRVSGLVVRSVRHPVDAALRIRHRLTREHPQCQAPRHGMPA